VLLGANPVESAPYSGGKHVQRLMKTDKGDKGNHKATHKATHRVIPSLDDTEEKFVHRME